MFYKTYNQREGLANNSKNWTAGVICKGNLGWKGKHPISYINYISIYRFLDLINHQNLVEIKYIQANIFAGMFCSLVVGCTVFLRQVF